MVLGIVAVGIERSAQNQVRTAQTRLADDREILQVIVTAVGIVGVVAGYPVESEVDTLFSIGVDRVAKNAVAGHTVEHGDAVSTLVRDRVTSTGLGAADQVAAGPAPDQDARVAVAKIIARRVGTDVVALHDIAAAAAHVDAFLGTAGEDVGIPRSGTTDHIVTAGDKNCLAISHAGGIVAGEVGADIIADNRVAV